MLKIGTKTSDLNVMHVATRQEARRTLDIMSKPGIGKKNILEVSKQKTNIALIKHSEQVLQKGMIVLPLFSRFDHSHHFQFYHGKTNLE